MPNPVQKPTASFSELYADISSIAGFEHIAPGLSLQVILETIEQAPVAISITDCHANILYVNQAFEELTGYSREAINGQNESVLSCKTTPIEIYRELWNTIKAGQAWRGTLVNRNSDGKRYLAEVTIAPVLNANHEITNFLGMHRDISVIHELEQRLKQQKILSDTIFDLAPAIMVLLDSDNTILMANKAYQQLQANFIHEPIDAFREALQDRLVDIKNNAYGNFQDVQLRLITKHGRELWFTVSGIHVEELDVAARNYFKSSVSGNHYLLLVASDITTRKAQMERARIQQLKVQMAEQELTQSIRETLAGAVFHLESPLNVLQAALVMPPSSPEMLYPILKQVMESSQRAIEAMRMAIPKVEEGRQSWVNLNQLLKDLLIIATDRMLAEGVTVDWQPDAVLPAIIGNEASLRRMFHYLLDNALLSMEESEHLARELGIRTYQRDGMVWVDIADNGIGIPANMRLRVFEPFQSGWKRGAGKAGMGLSMAQEIVNQHGGGISIDPHYQNGCRIMVNLPLKYKNEGME